jgi:PAS domain S-box-containing protein
MDRPPPIPLNRYASELVPYVLAVAAVSLGVMLRLMLAPRLGGALPFITLFPAVFLVALLFGLGPTVVATVASLLAALQLFFGPPHDLLSIGRAGQIGALFFALTGVGIGWLGEARLRARRLAEVAVERARAESERAEEETIRAEEHAARAEEETLRAEEETLRAQRESERASREVQRIEQLLASIGDAFLVVDRRWLVTFLNRAAAGLLGVEAAAPLGRPLWELLPDDPAGAFTAVFRRAMAGEQDSLEAFYAPLGKWLQVTAYPTVEGMSIVARDVSDQVQAHESVQRLAAIVVNSEHAIVGKLLDGTITSWNAAAERIFGYPAKEMVGGSIFTLVPPELHDAERDMLERVRRGEPVAFGETERIRKDGERITIALSVSPIRDATGRVVGASSIKRDITSERRTERLLAAETARSRELGHALDAAQVMMLDREGRITYWSHGAERLYGWSEAEALGRPAAELLHAQMPLALSDIRRELVRRGRWEGHLMCTTKNGRQLAIASQWLLRRGPDGEAAGMVQVDTDETARREFEERARQSERLEVVGQLAGGVAHEANNQMTVVLGAVGFLLRRAELTGDAREDVEQIRAAAERTASITGQLLAFSRRQVLQPRILDFDETVLGLQAMLQRTLGERSTLELQLRSSPALVKADPGQLAQVLLNLTLNARDAMPMGGRLTVETFRTELTGAYAGEHPGVTVVPGWYVVLAVSDSVHVMTVETSARVFEPFYTTKPVGKGTGLGLATVYGIVKQSGGYVWVYSELGRGTMFKVYLPESVDSVPEGSPRPPMPRALGETVLVVEDDPGVRQMASRALREFGYHVLEAGDGVEALEILSRNESRVRVVVADVVMPGMDGHELASRAQAVKPGLPVLFMSGYTDDEVVRRGLLEAGQPFLQKPFTPEALGERVGRLIKREAGRAG